MGFFSRPLQRGEEPGRDGADAQTLHGLGSGSCLGGQAGLAEICQIHPEFPRRKKGDLQNSLLREPPDSAVSKARQIQPRRKTPPKERLRQFVARCLENSRESICARATDLLPPLGEGVEEVGDRLEGFFQLPWRLPRGEQHGKELLCTERQGWIFSSHGKGSSWFMHRGRVHVLAERKEGEKVILEVRNFLGPLPWPSRTFGRASKSCKSSREQNFPPPLSHPSPVSAGYNLQLFPLRPPAGLGTPEERFSPLFQGHELLS